MAESRSIETYRSLRDMIKNAAGDASIRSVLVVDVDRPSPSSVAQNLAAAFRTAGDSCVLIDTNFRNPSADVPGLSDLVDDASVVEQVLSGEAEGVVGPGTIAAPDLLSSNEFPRAMTEIAGRFDYAVVTCDMLSRYQRSTCSGSECRRSHSRHFCGGDGPRAGDSCKRCTGSGRSPNTGTRDG